MNCTKSCHLWQTSTISGLLITSWFCHCSSETSPLQNRPSKASPFTN